MVVATGHLSVHNNLRDLGSLEGVFRMTNKTKCLGTLDISFEAFAKFFKFPEGAKIVSVKPEPWDEFAPMTCMIKVEWEKFSEVSEGASIPQFNAEFRDDEKETRFYTSSGQLLNDETKLK